MNDNDCPCGSGQSFERVYDARGIYLCRCCDQCRAEKLGGFRPEVLSNPGYETNEDVDGEYDPADWADV